jgi:hypothetical protein
MRYGQARKNLDRHPDYIRTAYMWVGRVTRVVNETLCVMRWPCRGEWGGRARVPVQSAVWALGGMFWLNRNTLSGSYLSFSATSRAHVSAS